jgi:hypothetical protein
MKNPNIDQEILMGLPADAEVLLPKGRSLVLEHALGRRIDLRRGVLWLTEPGRPRDIFLREGQQWVLGSDDRVVLTAWTPSQVRVGGRERARQASAPASDAA